MMAEKRAAGLATLLNERVELGPIDGALAAARLIALATSLRMRRQLFDGLAFR